MKFVVIVLGLLMSVVNASAIDMAKCSALLNKGWYKTYEYAGIDQPLTKATKKHGMSKATSVTSTEGSTASLDPGYTTNVSTSQTQGISSYGDCSLIGRLEIKERRDLYFAQNREEALKEVALGGGEHLRVIGTYSLCDNDKMDEFQKMLQSKMKELLKVKNGNFREVIDRGVSESPSLVKACIS